jgi:hypothetical protein
VAYSNSRREWRAPGKRHLTAEDYAMIAALYAECLIDREVAQKVGCSSKTVARWRWTNGKPANGRAE